MDLAALGGHVGMAADAQLIVSRDRRLLDFALRRHRKARTFNSVFPQLAILTPPEALALVRATQTATSRVDQGNS